MAVGHNTRSLEEGELYKSIVALGGLGQERKASSLYLACSIITFPIDQTNAS